MNVNRNKGGGEKLMTKKQWSIDWSYENDNQSIDLKNDDRSIDHTKMTINPKQCRGQQRCYDQNERDHEWQRKWKLKWKWSSIEYYLTATRLTTAMMTKPNRWSSIAMATKAMKMLTRFNDSKSNGHDAKFFWCCAYCRAEWEQATGYRLLCTSAW